MIPAELSKIRVMLERAESDLGQLPSGSPYLEDAQELVSDVLDRLQAWEREFERDLDAQCAASG